MAPLFREPAVANSVRAPRISNFGIADGLRFLTVGSAHSKTPGGFLPSKQDLPRFLPSRDLPRSPLERLPQHPSPFRFSTAIGNVTQLRFTPPHRCARMPYIRRQVEHPAPAPNSLPSRNVRFD